MSACPTCGKPVDAIRARHVAVRDGKITAYCSPECLASAEPSKPNVAPPRSTPAQGVVKSGVAPDSGPVIEIRYEPASGVVTSAPDPRSTPRTLDALAEPKPEATKADVKKPEPAKETAKKPEPAKEPKTPLPKPLPKPDEPKKDDNTKRLSVVGESGRSATDIPPGAEPAKLSPAKISDVAAKTEGTGTSVLGPRRPGRATIKRDDANVEQAEDWIDDEPADERVVRAGTDVSELDPPPKRGRGVLVTLVVVLLLAGGVVVAYQVFGLGKGSKKSPKTGSAVGLGTGSASGSNDRSGSSVGSGSAKRVVGPPTEEVPLTRAYTILRRYLEDNSPRVQRVAAAALSRTGDKVAIERLATALSKDKLEFAGQLDVAYALARAGDQRGRAALVAAIGAPRRDDKLAAGRLLVQLGDKAGVDTLAAYLEVPQHRLGAAEQLARLSEPRGLKVLEAILADKAASTDDKARAVIGLGLAGKAEVTEELRTLLTNSHFNVYAAEALALRHDESARAVLAKQLELSSLRVGAARALRLLAPQRDTSQYLETLTTALDDPRQQRDTEQIQLAEAILLLAGPARWSERT